MVTIMHQKALRILSKLCLLPEDIIGEVLSNCLTIHPKKNIDNPSENPNTVNDLCFIYALMAKEEFDSNPLILLNY